MLVVFFFHKGNRTYHWKNSNHFSEPEGSKAVLASSIGFYEDKLHSDKGFVRLYTRPAYTSAQVVRTVPFSLKPEEPAFEEVKGSFLPIYGKSPFTSKRKVGEIKTETKTPLKKHKPAKPKKGVSEVAKEKGKAPKNEKKKTEKKPTIKELKVELKKRGLPVGGKLEQLQERLNNFLTIHPEPITDDYGEKSITALRNELSERGLEVSEKTSRKDLLLALRKHIEADDLEKEVDDTGEELVLTHKRKRIEKGPRENQVVFVQLRPWEQILPERQGTQSYKLMKKAGADEKKIRLIFRSLGEYVVFDNTLSDKFKNKLSKKKKRKLRYINIHRDDILGDIEVAKGKALLEKKIHHLDDKFLIEATLKETQKKEILVFLDLIDSDGEPSGSSGNESYYGQEDIEKQVEWELDSIHCAVARDKMKYEEKDVFEFPDGIKGDWDYPEHLNLDFYDHIEAYVALGKEATEKSWQKGEKLGKINSHKWEYSFPQYNKEGKLSGYIDKKINVLKTQVRIPEEFDSEEEADDEAEGEEYVDELDEEEEDDDYRPGDKVHYDRKEWVIDELIPDENNLWAVLKREETIVKEDDTETGEEDDTITITTTVDVTQLDLLGWDPHFEQDQYVFFDGKVAKVESIDFDKRLFTIVSEEKKYTTEQKKLSEAILSYKKGQFVVYEYKKCRIGRADSTNFSYNLEVEGEDTVFTDVKEKDLNQWCVYKESGKAGLTIMQITREENGKYKLKPEGGRVRNITAREKITFQENVDALFRDPYTKDEEEEEEEEEIFGYGDVVLLSSGETGVIVSETKEEDAFVIYIYKKDEEEGKRKYVTIKKDNLDALIKLEGVEFVKGREVKWEGQDATLVSKIDEVHWKIRLKKDGTYQKVEKLDVIFFKEEDEEKDEEEEESDEEDEESDEEEMSSSDEEERERAFPDHTLVTHSNDEEVYRVHNFHDKNGYTLISIEDENKKIVEQDDDKVHLYEPYFEEGQWVRLKEDQKEYRVEEVFPSKAKYKLSDRKEYFESKLKFYEPLLRKKDWVRIKETKEEFQVKKILLREAKYLLGNNKEYFDSELEKVEKEEEDEEEEDEEEEDELESEEEEEEDEEEEDEEEQDKGEEEDDDEPESEQEDEEEEDESQGEEEESEGEESEKEQEESEEEENEREGTDNHDWAPLPPATTRPESFSSDDLPLLSPRSFTFSPSEKEKPYGF